jgi:hypothetical protein
MMMMMMMADDVLCVFVDLWFVIVFKQKKGHGV